MRLCYRGVEYDYNPPSLEVRESEMTGCYRGQPVHFSYVRHIPIPQPVGALTYRGVTYQTNSYGQIEAPATPLPSQSVDQQALKVQNTAVARARRALLMDAAEVHRQSLARVLEHRMAVAKAQGNESLLQQLEQEMHQMA